MNVFVESYNKLKKLRECGVKMKDIADKTDMTASILSSLYSSVLPAYVTSISSGTESEQALDEALLLVNNVSKRKLLASIDGFYDKLSKIEPRHLADAGREYHFFDDIEKEAIKYIGNVSNYSGLYMAYSRSSYKDALKVEPYLICPITNGEFMPKVACMNQAGQPYWGTGLFSAHQMGYLFFNEQKMLQIGLKTVFLQLPMFDSPKLIKGIYLAHDYNRNPIARRVVFVKVKNEITIEEFQTLKILLIAKSDLSEEERYYYDYTCQDGDYVRSFMVASPDNCPDDFNREKMMLKM